MAPEGVRHGMLLRRRTSLPSHAPAVHMYAEEFGIKIDPHLASVEARVLPPPKLKYRDSGRERDVLPRVGQWNMMKKVRRLLDEGMDVNALAWGPKCPGATPLHLAAQGGHVKIMDELLECGANIDTRTKGSCGWTPLHIAAKERNKKAVRFLIENGAFLPPEMNDHRCSCVPSGP